jgi:hypothetical protein
VKKKGGGIGEKKEAVIMLISEEKGFNNSG